MTKTDVRRLIFAPPAEQNSVIRMRRNPTPYLEEHGSTLAPTGRAKLLRHLKTGMLSSNSERPAWMPAEGGWQTRQTAGDMSNEVGRVKSVFLVL